MKREIMKIRSLFLGFAFLGVMAFILTAGYTHAAQNSGNPATPASFANLADKVKGSVVNISTTQVVEGNPLMPFMGPGSPFRDFFGPNPPKQFFGNQPHGKMETHALGSGFVISKEGLIITNNHVVEKASEIKVKSHSGKEYDAKLVGKDPKTDLALIQVEPDKDFPAPAVLGDSDAMRVGDLVMAVGNPFGLGHTVTTGIISAKSRILGAGPYDDFLQTDAAINPGNSGGPLLNLKGEVIGINTAIIASGQGIGFAIPVNLAKDIIMALKNEGEVTRGWLGVAIQNITEDLAQSFELESLDGVIISNIIRNGPADEAGLTGGDVITQINGAQLRNMQSALNLISQAKPGSAVKISGIRRGKEFEVTATVIQRPRRDQ